MNRRYERIPAPSLGRSVQLLSFGHYGQPLIAFPSMMGNFFDWESGGAISDLQPWIDAGKLKVYCPESVDHESWLNHNAPPIERAARHREYELFVMGELLPFIRRDCVADDISIWTAGCSMGAYQAVNFALKYPTEFSCAFGASGRYDTARLLGGWTNIDVYFNNPMAFVPNLQGEELERVRAAARIVLVCGQGAWEHQCLDETRRLAALLAEKGIQHVLDVWGANSQHHWHWWRKQVVRHIGEALG